MADRVCIVCGADLPRYKHKFCSLACKDLANNGVWAPSPKAKMKTCIDCGKPFLGATRSIRCRSCQLVSNNSSVRKATDAYHLRNLDEKKRKEGKTYERYGCIQRIGKRFYPRLFADGKLISLGSYDTLEAAADARVGAILERWPDANIVVKRCAMCGDLLPDRHISPYCRSCQSKKRAIDGYWKRQWAEMTPEQKQRKYAQYRKNYRLRKERKKSKQEVLLSQP